MSSIIDKNNSDEITTLIGLHVSTNNDVSCKELQSEVVKILKSHREGRSQIFVDDPLYEYKFYNEDRELTVKHVPL